MSEFETEGQGGATEGIEDDEQGGGMGGGGSEGGGSEGEGGGMGGGSEGGGMGGEGSGGGMGGGGGGSGGGGRGRGVRRGDLPPSHLNCAGRPPRAPSFVSRGGEQMSDHEQETDNGE